MEKETELKIALMMAGICVDKPTKEYLRDKFGGKFYNDDYVTTTGLMLEFDDTYVTAHFNNESPFVVKIINDEQYLFDGKEFRKISIWKPSEFAIQNKKSEFGLMTESVNVHFDRARISPIKGCSFHCAFCSQKDMEYEKHSIKEMDCALKEALKDDRVTHVLISGGTPKECDLPFMTDVYEYFCKNYPNYNFDVMMTPRGFDSFLDVGQYEGYVKHLKDIGVSGLSINLEIFDDRLCAKYCKEKFAIGKERYFKFLEIATKIFGGRNVRSGLIVGLENFDDTISAVERVCQIGCMPMLSPYIPYNEIGTFPNADDLIKTLDKAEKIAKKYNVSIAPLCKKCRHNTL